MATFMAAFPVLAGKEDDARKLAQETMGRSEEFSASQKRGGVTREMWSFQQTPMGSFMIVHFEAADIEKAFATMAQSSDAFDVWFRGRVQEVAGVDLAAEPEGPPPEIVLDWRA